ncbi:RING/U-box superfamily protein [Raphanus sativus]|uniref:RING-type E3 ubiquitin transferase n=1 Tax=Raphanus sativus TaxID=3726 RepID=A0A6J0MMF5_RAPSA|nr:E3 ubiquitin-protein ligase APD1 [Raphanus sativus]KAJ4906898.1 RING/U-box superfamily protein [Raphanus sativus]
MDSSPPHLPSVSSSSSSNREEEDVDPLFNHRDLSRPDLTLSGGNASTAGVEQRVSCFAVVIIFWFFVSMAMIVGVYGPRNVWIGPNSALLIEPNTIFVQSVKVKELDDSKSGLELFGFYTSPPLDLVVNWSESRLASVLHNSYNEWPYYLNKGASLNISYSVKPEGRSARLVVDEGPASYELLEKHASQNTALSWNLIRGNGTIEVKISKSSSYYVAVANSNMKDVEVKLDIDVRAILYDTKESFYKCTFSNGECTFNAVSLVENSIVLTSPAPRQGPSVEGEEEEWYVRFSYQPRWTSYVVGTGLVTCFMLVAIQLWKRLQCNGGESYQTDNDSTRTRLLVNKDEDGSSNESFAADDADLEDFTGNEGEASNSTRRLCAICFDAKRDCFFLPCGHCVSCYQCGTKIAEAAGSCPVCRRKMKKVKRIYTV